MGEAALLLFVGPLVVWWWREELVNLVSDCIAEGIRKARDDR